MENTPRERLFKYLEAQGMRITRERALIVDDVFASPEDFDAEQLVARLVLQRVSRSTIYRALAELEKAGLVRKVARTNDREIYRHN